MNPQTWKVLVGAGLVLVVAGLLAKYNLLSWLGRLPGDIRIERENIRFHFPLTTSILISLLVSLLFKLFRK
jgi:hypothetical protein